MAGQASAANRTPAQVLYDALRRDDPDAMIFDPSNADRVVVDGTFDLQKVALEVVQALHCGGSRKAE